MTSTTPPTTPPTTQSVTDPLSDPELIIEIKEYNKKTIPKALREQVWIKHIGKKFSAKCTIGWCNNTISPFEYHCAHIIAESKNGPTSLDNLVPTCSKCNLSMGNKYTVTEWNNLLKKGFFANLYHKLILICRIIFY